MDVEFNHYKFRDGMHLIRINGLYVNIYKKIAEYLNMDIEELYGFLKSEFHTKYIINEMICCPNKASAKKTIMWLNSVLLAMKLENKLYEETWEWHSNARN